MAAKTIPIGPSMNIRAVTYDEDAKDLVVQFFKGAYIYHEVDALTAEEFSRAPSPGLYFRAAILNQYPYERVG